MIVVFDNIVYSLQRAGGISVYWTEMCRRLEKDKSIEKLFIEENYSNTNIFRKDLNILNSNIQNNNSVLFKLTRYFNLNIKINKTFIFHSSYFRICSNKNAINVTTVYDFIYERYGRGLTKYIHKLVKKRAVKKSKAIICISESTKRDLIKYYPDIDRNKLFVIYLSISDDFFPIIDTKIDTPFSKNNYILFLGQRNGYKGFKFAVEVARYFGINLLFVGGGAVSETEEILLNKSLNKDSFIHLGNISSSSLNKLYNNAFCLLYPSIYEGFGVPLIEAQKSGCPVIAHSGSSIDEVVLNSALLIDELSINAVESHFIYLNNQLNREKIIEKGFINANRFSWDKSYEQHISIYKKLLDKN